MYLIKHRIEVTEHRPIDIQQVQPFIVLLSCFNRQSVAYPHSREAPDSLLAKKWRTGSPGCVLDKRGIYRTLTRSSTDDEIVVEEVSGRHTCTFVGYDNPVLSGICRIKDPDKRFYVIGFIDAFPETGQRIWPGGRVERVVDIGLQPVDI